MSSEEVHNIVALVVLSGVGLAVLLLAKLVWTVVTRHMSWDCPYCGFPSLKQLYRFSEDEVGRIREAAARVGNLQCTSANSFACTHCQRVVDDGIDPGSDPSEYWVINATNPNGPRPAETEAYPPLACRCCGDGVILSGGPEQYRVCNSCGSRHGWHVDEETSYAFYLGESESNTSGSGD